PPPAELGLEPGVQFGLTRRLFVHVQVQNAPSRRRARRDSDICAWPALPPLFDLLSVYCGFVRPADSWLLARSIAVFRCRALAPALTAYFDRAEQRERRDSRCRVRSRRDPHRYLIN